MRIRTSFSPLSVADPLEPSTEIDEPSVCGLSQPLGADTLRDRSGAGFRQAEQHPDQRRLPGAVGAEVADAEPRGTRSPRPSTATRSPNRFVRPSVSVTKLASLFTPPPPLRLSDARAVLDGSELRGRGRRARLIHRGSPGAACLVGTGCSRR